MGRESSLGDIKGFFILLFLVLKAIDDSASYAMVADNVLHTLHS